METSPSCTSQPRASRCARAGSPGRMRPLTAHPLSRRRWTKCAPITPAAPVTSTLPRATPFMSSHRIAVRRGPIDVLPISDRELARREFPYHDFLACEPIFAALKLPRERLPCRESPGIILRDDVDVPTQGPRELRRKACGLSPPHRLERENVREAVAQEQNVRVRVGLPWGAGLVLNRVNRHARRQEDNLPVGQLEHVRDVAHSLDDLHGLAPYQLRIGTFQVRRALHEERQLRRHLLHPLRCPVRVLHQKSRPLPAHELCR